MTPALYPSLAELAALAGIALFFLVVGVLTGVSLHRWLGDGR